MLSKGAELPRPPPTHPEEIEEELTETNDMQEEDEGEGLHRYGGISDSDLTAQVPTGRSCARVVVLCTVCV